MLQRGRALSTEDYTAWTNWWSLTTALTYLIGGFFPQLVFGSVGKSLVSPDASVHAKTVKQDYFSRGQTQFEPFITSILICGQKRVNV